MFLQQCTCLRCRELFLGNDSQELQGVVEAGKVSAELGSVTCKGGVFIILHPRLWCGWLLVAEFDDSFLLIQQRMVWVCTTVCICIPLCYLHFAVNVHFPFFTYPQYLQAW